ncbi:sulfotransferase [Poseidonocella sp. HB161398]|uniref:sulfotransferase n=1 Tax=Poseidonocella sp. HB161398 TaxID=2320855 RepID=UPI001109009B|nr:sulfotransferase [Poseidonocella sp. HB161398]
MSMDIATAPGKRLTFARVKASLTYRASARAFDAFEGGKRTLHRLAGSHPSRTLFIFGAQRSGTTHLERLFRADPRTVVFGEFSPLSIDPSKTVWTPLPELRRRLDAAKGSYAVARSLLASHRAIEILDAVPGSRAVWVFRRADEVVASMLRKWPGNFEQISRRVETGADGVWELETLWSDLHDRAEALSSAAPGSEARLRDLYALYWHARNDAFFDCGIDADPRIRLLDYQTLLARPAESMAALARMTGTGAPLLRFPTRTERRNPRVARPGYLSPEVAALCAELYQRLAATAAAAEARP